MSIAYPHTFLTIILMASCAVFSAESEKTVVCFGDSITLGRQPAALKAGECWVDRLQTLSKGRFHCINEGRGGRPASAIDEFKASLKRTPAFEVLILALGANDARDDNHEGPKLGDRVKSNLAEMITLARKLQPQAQIVLAAPYNINTAALKKNAELGAQRDANLHAIGTQVEALAREQKTLFVNFYGLLAPENLLADGVHPDSAGHEKVVQALWRVLEPVITK